MTHSVRSVAPPPPRTRRLPPRSEHQPRYRPTRKKHRSNPTDKQRHQTQTTNLEPDASHWPRFSPSPRPIMAPSSLLRLPPSPPLQCPPRCLSCRYTEAQSASPQAAIGISRVFTSSPLPASSQRPWPPPSPPPRPRPRPARSRGRPLAPPSPPRGCGGQPRLERSAQVERAAVSRCMVRPDYHKRVKG